MRGAFEVVRSQKTPPPKNSPLTLHIQDQGAKGGSSGIQYKTKRAIGNLASGHLGQPCTQEDSILKGEVPVKDSEGNDLRIR